MIRHFITKYFRMKRRLTAYRVFLAMRDTLSGNFGTNREDHWMQICMTTDLSKRAIKRCLAQLVEMGVVRTDGKFRYSILGTQKFYRHVRAELQPVIGDDAWRELRVSFDHFIELDMQAVTNSKQFSAWVFSTEVSYIEARFKELSCLDEDRERTPAYCKHYHAVSAGRVTGLNPLNLPEARIVNAEGEDVNSRYSDMSSSFLAKHTGLSPSRCRDLRTLANAYGYISSEERNALFEFGVPNKALAAACTVVDSLRSCEKNPHLECVDTDSIGKTIKVKTSNCVYTLLHFKRSKRLNDYRVKFHSPARAKALASRPTNR